MRLQYQAMCRKFISNPWTAIPHGHARTELNLLKKLIEKNGHECSIISESEEFGDILDLRRAHSFQSRIFLRNPLYTLAGYWKILRYFRSTIQKFRKFANTGDELIFSSVNYEQFVIATIFFRRQKLSLRVFNCPKSEMSKSSRYIVKAFFKNSKCKIGAETKEIATWLSLNLDLEAHIVPPLTLLRSQIKPSSKRNYVSKSQNIGIIYPVTSKFNPNEFEAALHSLEEHRIKVKLPISPDPLIDRSNLEIIPNGVPDELLSNLIYDLDIVILMNHNYMNRGSGLLTLCMSLGVQIFVFEDNNYVDSYLNNYPLIKIADIKQLLGTTILDWCTVKEPEVRMKLSHDFVDYVNLRWEDYLNVT